MIGHGIYADMYVCVHNIQVPSRTVDIKPDRFSPTTQQEGTYYTMYFTSTGLMSECK